MGIALETKHAMKMTMVTLCFISDKRDLTHQTLVTRWYTDTDARKQITHIQTQKHTYHHT